MGRAGWGLLFMTLISLAVAVNGIFEGNSVNNVIAENPTLDKLYQTDNNYSLSRSESYDNAIYSYIEGENTLTTETPDYYAGSWSYTKTILKFFKDLILPATTLSTIPAFNVFPATMILWIISIIWDLIIGLLIVEVVWRVNLFD